MSLLYFRKEKEHNLRGAYRQFVDGASVQSAGRKKETQVLILQ
jgi:hypothetical protein